MAGLLLPVQDPGWLGAAARPRTPPAVTGAKSHHCFHGLCTKGMLWTEIIQLGNTVIDRHSLRKQRAKAECPVISASFGSLLIFSITDRWRMHPNALTSAFAVTGILLTSQAPSPGHRPCSTSCRPSTQSVSLAEAIFLERLARASFTTDSSPSLVRKSI